MAEEPKKGQETKGIGILFQPSAELKAWAKQTTTDIAGALGKFSTKFAQSESQFGKDLGNASGDLSKVLMGFTGGFKAGLINAGKMVLDKLQDILVDAIDELDNLLAFSRISQSSTRNLMLGYGFSSSEAYGYSQAMRALGFQSDEDLMYSSPEEMEMFRSAFTKYTEKYSELYDKGFFQDMLEYQVEREEFEQDIKLEVTQFLVDNKDLIKSGMEAVLTLTKGFLDFVSIITGSKGSTKLNTSASVAAASSVINQYRGSTITMSNTFNNVTEANKTWINESVGASVTLLKQLQN